jgi:hypothetical protein
VRDPSHVDYTTKMKVGRRISWWDKGSETLIDELNIDHIPLEAIKALFKPPAEDPLMYNQYQIDQLQVQDLARWVVLSFDFNLYAYFVECWRLD